MLSNIKNLSLTKKLVYKIVFFIFCLIPFFSGLDSIPPLDRDESRFVQSTYQMIETNDYINIKFLDEIRAKKPIGIYWAQSIFANIFALFSFPLYLGIIFAVVSDRLEYRTEGLNFFEEE